MTEWQRMQKAAEQFQKNGFQAICFASGAEAAAWLAEQVQPGESVAFGGSVTLAQISLHEQLQARGAKFIEAAPDMDAAARRQVLLESERADAYFCSANALIEKGWVFNVDGIGNRVVGTIFGPGRCYIVAGANKLVPDADAAEERLHSCAAQNCRRLQKKTPCAVSGECTDCESPDRSCRIYVTMKRPGRQMPTTIVLIDETLGV